MRMHSHTNTHWPAAWPEVSGDPGLKKSALMMDGQYGGGGGYDLLMMMRRKRLMLRLCK